MVKVIFLGTNGWYDSESGNTVSILIKSSNHYIVLDAGNGIWKLDQYIKDDRPVYLFVSHFHLDHIVGLYTLIKNTFSKGLFIFIHEGGTDVLNRFVNNPFTVPIEELPFKTKIIEVPKNIDELPFKANFLPMVHSAFTLGVRLEVDNKIITYCPDTGYCKNAVRLSENADLLIAECAFKSNEVDTTWPHLNPELAAQIAKEAHVKKLVLTHFDAKRYSNLESRIEAERKSREIFEASYASKDGMEIGV